MRTLKERIAAATVAADYQKTLALLAALKDGECILSQVQLTENGWNIVEIVEAPEHEGNGHMPKAVAERLQAPLPGPTSEPMPGEIYWRDELRKALQLIKLIQDGDVNPSSVHLDIEQTTWYVAAPTMAENEG